MIRGSFLDSESRKGRPEDYQHQQPRREAKISPGVQPANQLHHDAGEGSRRSGTFPFRSGSRLGWRGHWATIPHAESHFLC